MASTNPTARGESYARPADPRDLSALISYGSSYEPWTAAWTDSRINQVQEFRRWVFCAIDVIASRIAEKRPNLSYFRFEGDPKSGKSETSRDRQRTRAAFECRNGRERALTPLQSHQWLEPIEPNHPLARLLADPNDPDTAYDLWYETVLFLLLTGSAYWWLPRNGLKLPEAIWVLPSHWVWPVVGKKKLFEGWELRPVEGNYLRQLLPADEVVHFRLKNPTSKIDGFGPLTATAQNIDVSNSIHRARLHSYNQGTFPTVAIQFDGTIQDPTQDFLDRVVAKFATRNVGERNANRPLFLPPGVKVIPLSLSPNLMLFGETATETRNNILAAFHVPPPSAGLMDGVSAESFEVARQGLCEGALNPRVTFLADVISEKVCPLYRSPAPIRCWWESFVPVDQAKIESQIKTDLIAGAITPDEIRQLRGREPFNEPWSRRPLMPVNMAPLALPGGGDHVPPGDQLPGTEPETPHPAPENPAS
jgi:HK97 family phage portal protein